MVSCLNRSVFYYLLVSAHRFKRQATRYSTMKVHETTIYSVKYLKTALHLVAKSNTGLLGYTPFQKESYLYR